MSYLTQNEIANNPAMLARVASCAAQEGIESEQDVWAYQHRLTWAAAPGWDAAWESAKVAHPEPEYDPGSDEAVITDSMILSVIQPMVASPGQSEQ